MIRILPVNPQYMAEGKKRYTADAVRAIAYWGVVIALLVKMSGLMAIFKKK